MILMPQIFDVTANENARNKRNELELSFDDGWDSSYMTPIFACICQWSLNTFESIYFNICFRLEQSLDTYYTVLTIKRNMNEQTVQSCMIFDLEFKNSKTRKRNTLCI